MQPEPENTLSLRLPGDVLMNFSRLPAGTFRMGARGEYAAEEPIHRVQISEFYMGVFPVTQRQYQVMAEQCLAELQKIEGNRGSRPSYFPTTGSGDQHPVENVSWVEAALVCRWLTDWLIQSEQMSAGWKADLPSEAQWEYACRLMKDASGQAYAVETEYYSGDGAAALADVGWYDANSGDTTHPVGQKKEPTSFGLYDLHGNVWEWCRDAWNEHAYKVRADGACDPVEHGEDGALRVIRGGGWGNSAWNCRAAYRYRGRPTDRFGHLGFRVCLFSGPSSCPAEPAAVPGAGASSEPRAVDGAGRYAEAESSAQGGEDA